MTFIQAKKSLGQHFLNSKHVLEQIINSAKLTKGEQVLEIGPGTGILTEALLSSGVVVTAIEKDNRAIELLKEKFETQISAGQLKIISGDILENNLDQIPSSPFKIVANIPYYITGAILEKFLENKPQPSTMVLLVQKEVAERIVAMDNKESVLSISVKTFGRPKIVAKVPRGAFTPPPTVDSAILLIENISDKQFIENNVDVKRFFEVVKAGFAHKRKYAIRNLETIISKENLAKKWTLLQLDNKVRAEDLEIKDWLEISKKSL